MKFDLISQAFAQQVKPVNPGGPIDPSALINSIINWVFGFAGVLAVLFIIIGGIRYIISAGNPDQAASARKTITYAVIGLLVTILAFAIVYIIIGLADTLN